MSYRLTCLAIFCLLTSAIQTSHAQHDWRLFKSPFANHCDSLTDCDGGICNSACDNACDSRGCQAGNSCYLSLFGGLTTLNDYNGISEENPNPPITEPPQLRGSFSDGIGFGVAIGREFHNCFRAELEYSLRSNAADGWWVNGAGTDWTGTLNTSAFMSNVYYDFQNCNFHNIVPYVGTGIGVVIANGDFSTPAIDLSIKDEAFAYQFIAGASKKMSSSVDLFAEYRFLESSDLEIKKTSTLPAAKIGDYASKSNNVFFGLRWSH